MWRSAARLARADELLGGGDPLGGDDARLDLGERNERDAPARCKRDTVVSGQPEPQLPRPRRKCKLVRRRAGARGRRKVHGGRRGALLRRVCGRHIGVQRTRRCRPPLVSSSMPVFSSSTTTWCSRPPASASSAVACAASRTRRLEATVPLTRLRSKSREGGLYLNSRPPTPAESASASLESRACSLCCLCCSVPSATSCASSYCRGGEGKQRVDETSVAVAVGSGVAGGRLRWRRRRRWARAAGRRGGGLPGACPSWP